MSMRCSSLAARATAAILLSSASLSASAAMIVPTGGTMTLSSYYFSQPSQTVQIAAEYGDFQGSTAISYTYDGPTGPVQGTATTTRVTGNYSSDSLSLIPAAYAGAIGMYGSYSYFTGGIQGTLGFDLTDDARLQFAFSEIGQWTIRGTGLLTIRDARGQIVLGCTVSDYWGPIYGGCAQGRDPYPPEGLSDSGLLNLAAGHYDISFDLRGGVFQDAPFDADFAFNLSVVPLPAALPLLLSGLSLLGMTRPRRRLSQEALART